MRAHQAEMASNIRRDQELGGEMARRGRNNPVRNLKTRTKLLAGFGFVSSIIVAMAVVVVLTLQQLSAVSQTVYADYTVPLADFAEMGGALTFTIRY